MISAVNLKPENSPVADNKASVLRKVASGKKKWSKTTIIPDKDVTPARAIFNANERAAQRGHTPNYMRPTVASTARNQPDLPIKITFHDVSKKARECAFIGISGNRKQKVTLSPNIDSLVDEKAQENASRETEPTNSTAEENRMAMPKADSILKKNALLDPLFPETAKAPWIPAGIAKGRTITSERTSLGASSPCKFKNYALGCRELTVEKKRMSMKNTSNTKRDTVLKDALHSKTPPLGKKSQMYHQQKTQSTNEARCMVNDVKQEDIQLKQNMANTSDLLDSPNETYSDSETKTFVIHKNKNLKPKVLLKEKVPNVSSRFRKTKTVTNRKISNDAEPIKTTIREMNTPSHFQTSPKRRKNKTLGIQLSQAKEETDDSYKSNTKSLSKSQRPTQNRLSDETTASLTEKFKGASTLSLPEKPAFIDVHHHYSSDESSQKQRSIIEKFRDEETIPKEECLGEGILKGYQNKALQSLAVFNWVDISVADPSTIPCAQLEGENANDRKETGDTIGNIEFVGEDSLVAVSNGEIVNNMDDIPECSKSQMDEFRSVNNLSQNAALEEVKLDEWKSETPSDSKIGLAADVFAEEKIVDGDNLVTQPSDYEFRSEPSYGKEVSEKPKVTPPQERSRNATVTRRSSKTLQNQELKKYAEKEQKKSDKAKPINRNHPVVHGVVECRTISKGTSGVIKPIACDTVPTKTVRPNLSSSVSYSGPANETQKAATLKPRRRTLTKKGKGPPQRIRTKSVATFIKSVTSTKGPGKKKASKVTSPSKSRPKTSKSNVKAKTEDANKKKKKKMVKKKKEKGIMPLGEKTKGDSKVEMFKEQFKLFAKFGDRRNTGYTISMPNTMRWLKQAGIVDNRRVYPNDVEIFFIHCVRRRRSLTNLEFVKFLGTLCSNKDLDIEAVVQCLLECGEPVASFTDLMIAGLIASESAHPEPPNPFAKPLTVDGLPDLKNYPYKSSTAVRQLIRSTKNAPSSEHVVPNDNTRDQSSIVFPIPENYTTASVSGEFRLVDLTSDGENTPCELPWSINNKVVANSSVSWKPTNCTSDQHDYTGHDSSVRSLSLAESKKTTKEQKERNQEIPHRQRSNVRNPSPQHIVTYAQEERPKSLQDDQGLTDLKDSVNEKYSTARLSTSGEKTCLSPNSFAADKRTVKKIPSLPPSPQAKFKGSSVFQNWTEMAQFQSIPSNLRGTEAYQSPMAEVISFTENNFPLSHGILIGNSSEKTYYGDQNATSSYYCQTRESLTEKHRKKLNARKAKRFEKQDKVQFDNDSTD